MSATVPFRPDLSDRPLSSGGYTPRGLTLTELVAAIAIVAILATIVTSVAGGAVHRSRAAAARAAMLDTYQVAIRHASTRAVPVVACPAGAAGACRDSIDWSGGWRVFEDADRDREHDSGERIVANYQPLGDRVHLRSTEGRKRLVFQPSGGNAGSNATFTLCDGRGPDRATQLILSNLGRLREARAPVAAAASCMVPAQP